MLGRLCSQQAFCGPWPNRFSTVIRLRKRGTLSKPIVFRFRSGRERLHQSVHQFEARCTQNRPTGRRLSAICAQCCPDMRLARGLLFVPVCSGCLGFRSSFLKGAGPRGTIRPVKVGNTAGQNPGRYLHRFAHASLLPVCVLEPLSTGGHTMWPSRTSGEARP